MSIDRLFDKPGKYQIRIQGHLDSSWSDWLDGLAITHEENDTTLLTGLIADQSALYGLLIKLRDLSLILISLRRVASGDQLTNFVV